MTPFLASIQEPPYDMGHTTIFDRRGPTNPLLPTPLEPRAYFTASYAPRLR
jgi:hypothetical protein